MFLFVSFYMFTSSKLISEVVSQHMHTRYAFFAFTEIVSANIYVYLQHSANASSPRLHSECNRAIPLQDLP